VRIEPEPKGGPPGVNRVRRAAPPDPRSPLDIVEADVSHHVLVARTIREARAASLPPCAAHLENVGEVRIEPDDQRHLDRLRAVIADADHVDAEALAKDARAEQVDLAVREHQPVVAAHVDIGQVGDEHEVVIADRRAQKQRPASREQNLERREEPRSVIVEPVLAGFGGDDVAVLVEHRERVALLQDACGADRALRVGGNRKIVFQLENLWHQSVQSAAVWVDRSPMTRA
jgi:hypothetical protein